MKRLLSLLLTLGVVLSSYAYDFQYNGIYYNVTDDVNKTVEVTKVPDYNYYSGDIVIPNTVIYNSAVYNVTRIGNEAFLGCQNLTSVVLPDGLKSIGEMAFAECESLTAFIIPNSVTSIEYMALRGCWRLTSIVIPEHVTSIAPGAFGFCHQLAISVSEKNSKYDSRGNCNAVIETATNTLAVGLGTTTIPNDITCIGELAFLGCHVLENLTIPVGVTTLENGAFAECYNLQNITFPNTLQVIGDETFSHCPTLANVSIPDYVKAIGRNAFCDCNHLTSVTLGNSVKYIGENAFAACYELSSIVIPNSVTELGAYAFSGCSKLENVTLSKNLKNVGQGAFDQTPWYNALKESSESKYYNMVYINDIAYQAIDRTQTTCNFRYGTKAIAPSAFYNCSITGVTIPEGVTSIGSSAFSYCSSLTYVILPESVTEIGNSAFSNCRKLSSITIPNSVIAIGYLAFAGTPWYEAYREDTNNVFDNIVYINDVAYTSLDKNRVSCTFKEGTKSITEHAFSSCENLTEVNIPAGVTAIGKDAFLFCSNLSKVIIPQTIATIGSRAFYWCDNLADVICLAEDVPEGTHIFSFSEMDPNATLYVPESSVEAYKASNTWNRFSNIVGFGPEHDTDISAIDNTIYFDNCEAFCGKTIELPIKMKNDIVATGFQFDIELTEGISAVQDEDGFYDITLSTERTTAAKTNTFDSSLMSDGSIRVLAASTRNYAFSGNDGEVCIIKLKVSEDLPAGEYPIILKNIELTNAQGQTWNVERLKRTITVKDYQLGDANGDGRVSVGDFSAVANHILGTTPEGFNIGAADANQDNNISVGDLSTIATMILTSENSGASKVRAKAPEELCDPNNFIYADPVVISEDGDATIVFNMKNEIAATGFQFNFKLPEGFEVSEDEDGFLDVFLSQIRTTSRKTNTFDCVKWDDGSYRVLAASTKNYEFSGNDGEVVTVHIKKKADVESGDYELLLTDIELTNASGQTFRTSKATYTIVVPAAANEIALVDGEEYSNNTTTTYDALTYTRTFANTEWQALYVPFAMNYDDWAEEFEVARISGMHMYDYDENGEVDETCLEILRVKKGALMPNTPYLIRAKETGEKTIALTDAVLYATDKNSYDVSTWDYRFTFNGTYAMIPGTTMVADGFYALGGGLLHQAEDVSNALKPFRWYMTVSDRRSVASTPNKVVLHLMGEEDLTTGIVTPLQPQDKPADAHCYDLSGRRVTIPTKGVFIKNGKKTIVR